MRTRQLVLVVSVLIGSVTALGAQARQTTPPPAPAAAATNDIAVTVNYTGKGVVDAGHSVLVFLFTDANIGPTSQPIGPPQIARKNGDIVTFKALATRPLYVVGVYNEKGTYDGGGPPTAGLPIGIYRKDAQSPPTAVTPGAKTAVKLTFNDAKRWGQ